MACVIYICFQSIKDLEVENQLQNTEELQNEIAALKEKIEVMV